MSNEHANSHLPDDSRIAIADNLRNLPAVH
jgi:hypothetical protein